MIKDIHQNWFHYKFNNQQSFYNTRITRKATKYRNQLNNHLQSHKLSRSSNLKKDRHYLNKVRKPYVRDLKKKHCRNDPLTNCTSHISLKGSNYFHNKSFLYHLIYRRTIFLKKLLTLVLRYDIAAWGYHRFVAHQSFFFFFYKSMFIYIYSLQIQTVQTN